MVIVPSVFVADEVHVFPVLILYQLSDNNELLGFPFIMIHVVF